MRVSQSGSNQVPSSEASASKKTGRAGAAADSKDVKKVEKPSAGAVESSKAEISDRGREMAQAKSVATDASDVREERIAELKRRISTGKYNVEPDKIADRMVDEHLSSGIG